MEKISLPLYNDVCSVDLKSKMEELEYFKHSMQKPSRVKLAGIEKHLSTESIYLNPTKQSLDRLDYVSINSSKVKESRERGISYSNYKSFILKNDYEFFSENNNSSSYFMNNLG